MIELYNMNVTYIALENTINTKVKQIRNPQKEISGGFFIYTFYTAILIIKINPT